MTVAVVVERLEQLLEQRDVGSGAQLWVAHRGIPVVDIAVGTTHRGPMHRDLAHASWCLTKPVLSLIAAAVVAEAGHPPTVALRDLGVDHPSRAVGDATVQQLLGQRTCFGRPTLVEARLHTAAERQILLDEVGSPSHPMIPRPGYSEWVVGALFERAIEALTLEPAGPYVQERLDEAGLPIGLAPGGPTRTLPVGCYRWLDGGSPDARPPLLHDLAEPTEDNRSPAVGGVTSMAALGAWYLAFACWQQGGRAGTLFPPLGWWRACVEHAVADDAGGRHLALDPLLGRPAPCAGGLMVSLGHHGFGPRPGSSSVGHLGWSGSSFGCHDPDADLVIAALVNGATQDAGRLEPARQELISWVYDLIGERSG